MKARGEKAGNKKAGNPDGEVAELQRRLAAREAELAESLAQQTAAAEILEIINACAGDLAPVFNAILERSMRLCEAAYGHFVSYDGELFHRVAVRGKPEVAEWQARHSPSPSRGEGTVTFQRLLRGETIVHVPDVMDTDAYRAGNPAAHALVDIGGCRSLLTVGLRKHGSLLGLISIYREGVRPFSEKQIALLQNFAAQAVIAMENARLITETREALEQQTATAEVLGVINASPGELAPVFDAMLDKGMRLCEADFAGLWTFDGEHVHPAALHRVPPAYAEFMTRRDQPVSPDNTRARLIRGEPFVHIPDAAALPDNPLRRAFVELGGGRAQLAVPLRKDEALIGILTVYRREPRPFTEKQIALLQNFAAQAVIAMENARLITETREALEQQTATSEVLGVINSSPGDLVPVFDAMVEKAMRLCGAWFGGLQTYDGESFVTVAARGGVLPVGTTVRPQPGFLLDRLVRGQDIVHVTNVFEDPAYHASPAFDRMVEAGVRALLVVALKKDATLLGAIGIYGSEARPFTNKQIALLQNFAAQAVIAMENARLLGELRQRTSDLEESLEYQTATSNVLQVISRSTFDLRPVLQTLVETAARICVADQGVIFRRDDDGYRAAATVGIPPEYNALLLGARRELGRGTLLGRVVQSGRPVHVDDLATDPEYASPQAVTMGMARTGLGVPLLREGEPIGVINLVRRRVEPFTEQQIELVRNFADQAVIAMENARLLGELRQRTEEVAELNRGLEARVAEQVEELGRVGRLKRFLAPQLAELIVSQGDEKILESHRREIVVVFCDLRGFTAFAETAEPEEVLELLREYHAALGPLVSRFEGTLDHFSGDGIMVFFNDPVPCPDPAERAVRMAIAMRAAAGGFIATWRRRGRELGFGVGIAQGYATLGQIGFADRSDYTAIGTVCNLAARLCDEAKDGQILLARRVAGAVEETFALQEIGNLALKGLTQPVSVFNVIDEKPADPSAKIVPLPQRAQQPG